MKEVRVRFAPSPTGRLHIGGLRTALYNYLYARSKGGKMILRIEDTDRKRYVEGAESYLRESLEWSGIDYDEGPWQGGKYGPYRQSERLEKYKKYAEELVGRGWAYYAYDSQEELEEMRKQREASGEHSPRYDFRVREKMNTSLGKSEDEIKRKLESGEGWVIRFKMPEEGEVKFVDKIRGEVKFNCRELDDKVLIKEDGWPTYHLANVVDDHLMEITQVIRGEEWLSSTGLHVMLYRAMGWESEMPEFGHLPLILKPSGKGKLSKRDGSKHGIPVFPLEWQDRESGERYPGFRGMGFDARAMVNFMAFLGWNPGGEREIYSLEEMVEIFDWSGVGKGGSRFDFAKAKWFNQQYLQSTSGEELAKMARPYLAEKGYELSTEKLERVCELMRDRIQLISELPEAGVFFFTDGYPMDEKMWRKKWVEGSEEMMEEIAKEMRTLEEWKSEEIKKKVVEYMDRQGLKFGEVLPLLRLTLTGTMKGPDIFSTAEILGQEEVQSRIDKILSGQKRVGKGRSQFPLVGLVTSG